MLTELKSRQGKRFALNHLLQTLSEDSPKCRPDLGKVMLTMACETSAGRNKECEDRLLASLKNKRYPAIFIENNTEAQVLAQLISWCETDQSARFSEEALDFLFNHVRPAEAMAAFACMETEQALKTLDVTASMNLEAIRGETGAFDDRLHSLARPYKGQIDSAFNIRLMTKNSRFTTEEARLTYGWDKGPRVQDAISLRATPQTHGAARDVFNWCRKTIDKLLKEGELWDYAAEYAACGLITALADAGSICERRTFRLNDAKLSCGLPTNLASCSSGFNHGYPVVQSVQTALLAELKLLTLPLTAVKTNRECMLYEACQRWLKALSLLWGITGIELLMTAQAMDLAAAALPGYTFGLGSQAALKALRESVPFAREDRYVSQDVERAVRAAAEKEVLLAVESTVGELR